MAGLRQTIGRLLGGGGHRRLPTMAVDETRIQLLVCDDGYVTSFGSFCFLPRALKFGFYLFQTPFLPEVKKSNAAPLGCLLLSTIEKILIENGKRRIITIQCVFNFILFYFHVFFCVISKSQLLSGQLAVIYVVEQGSNIQLLSGNQH